MRQRTKLTKPYLSKSMNGIYSPLEHSRAPIRLLVLYPGAHEAAIECDLQISSLEDKPGYEALSYTWGESTSGGAVSIAGCLLSITDNLSSALRHLRYPERARLIWVDALCINQNDVEEKTKQVQIMGRIYTECAQCLIWLGEIPKGINGDSSFSLWDVEALFSLLLLLARSEPGEILPANLSHHRQRSRAACAITSMMFWGNKWWRRIWTVQVSHISAIMRESNSLIDK